MIFIFYFYFYFLIQSHHVVQADLQLLSSGSLPTLTSQSAAIAGVSHCAWPHVF
uniref:Macaca fascicularis brain cDNA clone: QflA-21384, similar to human p21 (CDKN1A)-activated kinase 2 (PAK2), mRNA, RefSeq: NM_002577.3 n=1 Tax=Macaca fascicularis TaxID=9541 RepID=I7GIN7_MACFA|nr:unnamed protein product [Macaca fascicularis]